MANTPALSWLRARGNQRRLRELVERLTGRSLAQSTTSRWATGDLEMSAAAEALIRVIDNPKVLAPPE